MRNKKPIAILAVVMAWLLFASTALAVVTIEADAVYANGHAITVVKDEASGDTRVTSDDAEAGLAGNTTNIAGRDIYGGKKDGDLTGNTSVTIQGGTVGDVYGGGKNGDVNGSTNVVVNGGTTGDVYGGGHAEGGDAGWSDGVNTTANVSNGTNVTVNGGTTGDVYGGGHADGGDRNLINDGGDATATVAGGTKVTINGGNVNGDVYGGGKAEAGSDGIILDDGFSDANVTGGTKVTISGGTVRDSVSTGGNDRGSRATAEVSGHKDVYINGGMIKNREVIARGNDTKIYVNSLIGLYYRYYTGDRNNNSNIVVNANLKDADGKTWKSSDLKWDNDGYWYFKGVPGEPQKVTVVFKYYDKSGPGGKVIETESSEVWVTDLSPSQTISSTRTQIGINRYAIKSVAVSYVAPRHGDSGDRTITEKIYPLDHKQVTVTTNYSITGVTLAPDVKTYTVYAGDPAQTVTPVMPTFAGIEHYTLTASPTSGSISYTSGNVVFTVTGQKLSKQVTVTTNYSITGVTLAPNVKTYTVYSGDPAQEVTAVMPTFTGSEHYTLTANPTSGSISYTSGNVVFTVTGQKLSKQVTVTTNYSITGVTLAPDVKTYTVYSGDPAQEVMPVMPTFTGSEHYTFAANPTSGSISYTSGDVVFNVTGQKLSKEVTVTTNYSVAGVTLAPDVKTYTVYSGEPAQEVTPVMPAFTGSQHYSFDSDPDSADISYTSGDVVFNVTGGPNSRTILVRFNYLYNGNVIATDAQSVTLTYGAEGKTVNPAPFSVPGYYLLAPVSPVTLDYLTALELETEVIEVEVLLGIADDDDVTPQIPLGPGTAQTAIPLGIGIPSTGDSTGISILLMAMGIAVVAIVAIKAKRSSAK